MLKYSLIFFVFSVQFSGFGQNLVVNEFMASNSHVLSDNVGEYDDWVEVYNSSTTAIDLAGYYFSDNPNNPYKFKIPATNPIFTTVPAGGYLVFWADGDTLQGPTHLGFKISAEGESILITNPQGIIEDEVTFSEQESNVSFSRIPDGTGPFYFCVAATPYAINNTTGYNGFVKSNPVFSVERGVYETPQSLELTKDFVSGEIRYTLDGTDPNLNSALYTTPIPILQNTTVRAAAFQDSLVPSEIKTHSYIFDVVADQYLPIISITGDSLLFYDSGTGLFTQNFLPSWEYKINFEIIDVKLGTDKSQEMGIEVLQDEGWQLPQKPINLRARDEYGKKNLKYRLFPNESMTSFKSFSLRNGIMDWGNTLVKDGLSQKITEDNMNLDNRFYRPSSVYINGVWQGVYNIRVNTDTKYPEELYGYNNDSIDIIKGNGALEGSPVSYYNWLDSLQNIAILDSLGFVEVSKEMDIENYTHHILSVLFFGNKKWATENSFQWKSKESDSKWRWFQRGYDQGMQMANIDSVLFDYVTDPVGGVNNPEWLTRPLRKLLTYEGYRQYFLSQLADHFYITFNPTLLNEKQDEVKSMLNNYMHDHISLWGSSSNGYTAPITSYQAWEDSLSKITDWYVDRGLKVHNDALAHFSELSSISNLNLQVQTAGGGEIAINSLTVPSDNWSGMYFDSLTFKLTAIPRPGYEFVGWGNSGLTDSTQAQFSMLLNSDTSIVAYFQASTLDVESVLITEIKAVKDTLHDVGDWLELYNPSDNWINLSNWVFEDGIETYHFPGNALMAPNSYVILAADRVSFLSWYAYYYNQDVGGKVFGNLNFGLSSDGGNLRLINSEGETIDSVDYLNSSPWPVLNNPDTLSIELVQSNFDNEYGHNWYASNSYLGTPLNPSGLSLLHIGKIPNQEVNSGVAFSDFDLGDYIYSPDMPLTNLTIEVGGNLAIEESISAQNIVSLSYSNWKGVEWITFKVSDTLGNSSIDSAQFLVGTILDQIPCNASYTINDSPILINQPITIPDGCIVNFQAGVEVRLKSNAEIIVQGEVNFLGNASDSVYVRGHLGEWNSIFIDSSANVSTFSYMSIKDATHGSDSVPMNAAIAGYYGNFNVNNSTFDIAKRAIYGYHGEASVRECYFHSSAGEKVNFQYTNGTVLDSYIASTYGDNDAIDFDAVNNGLIAGNTIVYGEDDGIDIGQIEGVVCDSLRVIGNKVIGIVDKAISVGEGSSNIFIERNVLANSYYGVAVKDGSQAFIDHNTIDGNNFAVALFEKNNGLEGSFATVENSILSNSLMASALIDATSSAVFNYNCSNVDVLVGIGNISADPSYANDYNLEYYSPCINTGDPVFSSDADGSRTDMGARWFDTKAVQNALNNEILIMPNPVVKGSVLMISWKLHDESEQTIQIFDSNGKSVFQKVYMPVNINDLGIQLLQLNSLALSSGIYYLRVQGTERILTSKFIVAP